MGHEAIYIYAIGQNKFIFCENLLEIFENSLSGVLMRLLWIYIFSLKRKNLPNFLLDNLHCCVIIRLSIYNVINQSDQ